MAGYEFSDKAEYELLKEGDYEVILDTAEVKTYKSDSSKRYLSLKFIIRVDVEQPHNGRTIYETVFSDKENPSQFDHRKLQRLILTQKGKDTFQTKFANEDELIQYLNGLTMRIHINRKEADDYHDSEYNEVGYLSYKPSDVKLQSVGQPTQQAKPKIEFVDMSDPDLPF